MGGLLNSSYLFFLIGLALGVYLGNKGVRFKVNGTIDKYIMKKKVSPPTKLPEVEPKENTNFVIVNGIKYYKDTTQDK